MNRSGGKTNVVLTDRVSGNAGGRAVAVCAVGLLLAILLAQTTLYQRLNWWLYDVQQGVLARPINLDSVVVFDADEAAIERLSREYGPWPYAHDVFADTARYLTKHGARTVAFNLLLAEERSGSQHFAEALKPNMVLAAAGLPITLDSAEGYGRRLAARAIGRELMYTSTPGGFLRTSSDHGLPHIGWHYLKLPLEKYLQDSGARVGVVNIRADDDGVVRKIGLFHAAQGLIYPSLPAAALLASAGEGAQPTYSDGVVQLARARIPVTGDGEALLRYPANMDGLQVIRFDRLALAAAGKPGYEDLAREVAGKTVFIGVSSLTSGDFVYTPLGRVSSLRLSAISYAGLGEGYVLTPSKPWVDGLLVILALGLGVLLLRRGAEATPRHFIAAFVTLPLFFAITGTLLFAAGLQSRWLFALIAGIATLAIVFSVWMFLLYDERRRLRYETLAAQEANRLKTSVLNDLTHELRTPLTAIMGFNKVNQFTEDLGREARIKNSAIIARNCEHLLQLVNNNLDLAKIEAGTLTIALAPEDPDQLCRGVVNSMLPFAEEKRIRLKFSRTTPLPAAVMLDAFRVRQVLINLLSNALRFTEAGQAELIVAWHVAALVFEVRDTGPGIPDEALQRIFEPYQQADPSVAQRHGGTGLGLAITRNLVGLMGGTLEVDSKVGVGSTFRVRLPTEAVAKPATVRPISDAFAPRDPLAGRVLLAEDNEDIRALLELQLGKLGLDVTSVTNGFSAVEAALASKFDVVLMDIEMPVMNGYEAVNVLRTRGYTGTMLALTAHQEGVEVERALASGCDGIITKPVTFESLGAALRQVLPEARRNAASWQ
jgi:signal transduction histidine kinase/ActR/RegA family two-component response regulator